MKVLLVDDELNLTRTLGRILERKNHTVRSANDGGEALEALKEGLPDVMVTDLMMPKMGGIELLKACQELYPDLPVIMLTGQGSIQNAVEAMKLGAYDYLVKPCNPDEILIVLDRVGEMSSLRREVKTLRRKVSRYEPYGDMIGASRPMQEIAQIVQTVAKKPNTVLITGESGTGKELVARAIHRGGHDAHSPFVAINCGALSETLLESQLFGHKKGSFTGAIADHDGFFKVAEGGVLFLDEIGEMPAHLQVKLLRAIQQREIIPIGAKQAETVNLRIVAATNSDLQAAVAAKEFREDLFYRLNVVNIHLPPLRDRREDIVPLIDHFIAKYAKEYGIESRTMTDGARELLQKYTWPGNIRELQNVIERAFAISDDTVIAEKDLPSNIRIPSSAEALMGAEPRTLEELERQKIVESLRKANGKKIEAARFLGIDRKRLYRKMKKYGI